MSKKSPKSPKKAAKAAKAAKQASQRWSLGIYRTESGRLAAVYCNAKGEPVPYLKERVGDARILFHKTYHSMTYSQARKQLEKDSKLRDAPVKKAAKAAPKKAA